MAGKGCAPDRPGSSAPRGAPQRRLNQRPGSAASWMPASRPLPPIAVTRLLPAMPSAADSMHLDAAIQRLRKKPGDCAR
ncbi:Uncharacterised protein [Bordetella pertussis]|nr:Uncharacterised protein [Bordetella pertussis]CFM55716.1 Uncharacterised protein [Bordetella pertussis]CFM83306.1 Uncharacterised protein [Bordetella pertussis]CFN09665.1 Uncharacterised protein [Bordetella pertussis]CFN69959.1 Uncharacterised protein [Bordetella pertussis]